MSMGKLEPFAVERSYGPADPEALTSMTGLEVMQAMRDGRLPSAAISEALQLDVIEVERGRKQPEQRWSANRAWAEVKLIQPRHRLHPTRLVIRSHGKEIEVGSFLVEEERQRLEEALRDALRRTD